MCGIAGLVDFENPPEESTLRAMESALIHRGPDEGGLFHSAHCGLAHRRLRIIDLSAAAAQPMTNEDGRVRVIFNGEIYNFHDLRAQLERLGHQFRSRSDTETLLHGYESWGLDLVARLRGMFAFALWDEPRRRLLLARDHLGKKPLFYSVAAGRLAFGSELGVFKAIPRWPLQISTPAFRQYVEWGYVPGSHSILDGVQRLPAGHYAVWDQSGLRTHRYWSLPQKPASRRRGSTVDAALELEAALRDAVACRLESDVPLGCFLSGGVDSVSSRRLPKNARAAGLRLIPSGSMIPRGAKPPRPAPWPNNSAPTTTNSPSMRRPFTISSRKSWAAPPNRSAMTPTCPPS